MGAIETPPQLLVWLKSVGLVPLLLIEVTVRLPRPVLVNVTGSVLVVPTAVDGKVSEVADRLTAGAEVPVPLRVTDCVEPLTLPELSVTTSVALRVPTAAGVNVTEIVQLPAPAKVVPQLLVFAKSPGFVPLITMLAMVNEFVPELLSVTDCAALVVLVPWEANVSEPGETAAAGGVVPVPVRVMVWVAPTLFELSMT